jgi:hypothetical protein
MRRTDNAYVRHRRSARQHAARSAHFFVKPNESRFIGERYDQKAIGMPERGEETPHGPVFSVARYYGQAGDLVPDPDVTLLRAVDSLDRRFHEDFLVTDDGIAGLAGSRQPLKAVQAREPQSQGLRCVPRGALQVHSRRGAEAYGLALAGR